MPEQGFDCAGWLHWAWTRYWGVKLPDWQERQTDGGEFHRAKQGRDLISHFLQDCQDIPLPLNGAGVLMKRGTIPNHVGIYFNGDIIHACEISGQIIREAFEDIRPKVLGFYVPSQTLAAAQ